MHLILTWLVCGLFQCEEAAYEERRYPAGKWACVTKGEPLYEQSISMSFMKLMRYICKENSVGVCRQWLEGAGRLHRGGLLPLTQPSHCAHCLPASFQAAIWA